MPDELSPDAVAAQKRQTMLEIGETEFRMWQHNPITAGFFQFLDDQITAWREIAADLVEAGAFEPGSRAEAQNPDVVRGRILAVRELRQITVQLIQSAYGKEPPVED